MEDKAGLKDRTEHIKSYSTIAKNRPVSKLESLPKKHYEALRAAFKKEQSRKDMNQN
jgi:hypothetical protein